MSGTAQNESIVTILVDGVAAAAVTPLSTAVESNTTGTWTVTVGPFAPGPHTIIASANYKTSNVILNDTLVICSALSEASHQLFKLFVQVNLLILWQIRPAEMLHLILVGQGLMVFLKILELIRL